MIEAKLNNLIVDVDEKTAIGITIQNYDIKEPGKRKVKMSNNFSLPLTIKNHGAIGFAGIPGHILAGDNNIIYTKLKFEYIVDNDILISGATVKVTEVSDRIYCLVVEKNDIWDELKNVKWEDFQAEYIEWLKTNSYINYYYTSLEAIALSFSEYANIPAVRNNHLIMPAYFGNLYNLPTNTDPLVFVEKVGDPLVSGEGGGPEIHINYFKSNPGLSPSLVCGGHFCAYFISIFKFIEWKFDVDFLTTGGRAAGNIWDDVYASTAFVPVRNLDVEMENYLEGYRFSIINRTAGPYTTLEERFLPLKDIKDKEDKTLYGLCNVFFHTFNVIIDEIILDNKQVFRLARFDDIPNFAEVIDFSGKLSGVVKFKPYIDGWGIKNNIKYASIYENGGEDTEARTLEMKNYNLDASTDLFTIDAHIPKFVININYWNGDDTLPDLSTTESFKTFEVLISTGRTKNPYVKWHCVNIDAVTVSTSTYAAKAELYTVAGEYKFLEEIVKYPQVFEITKYLNMLDIKGLQFFRQYWIKELGASFFINKIQGFNPEKSTEGTKIELLLTSFSMPVSVSGVEFYCDGVGDLFIDGENDTFY